MTMSSTTQAHKAVILFVLCSAMLLQSGCLSTTQYIHFPDQTKTIETAGKARLYVMFPYMTNLAVARVLTREGDQNIGLNATNGYLCWETDPGAKTLSSKVTGAFGHSAQLNMALQADQVYFVEQNVNPWSGGTISMRILSDAEGQKVRDRCAPPDE